MIIWFELANWPPLCFGSGFATAHTHTHHELSNRGDGVGSAQSAGETPILSHDVVIERVGVVSLHMKTASVRQKFHQLR
jgi:hypothetical protein